MRLFNRNRISLLLFAFILLYFTTTAHAQPENWIITQITDNDYHDGNPQIYGSNIVWAGHDGNDYEIFFYNGNTITQLTDNNYDEYCPQIHGSNIVWKTYDGNDEAEEIFFYDGNTTSQLTYNTYEDWEPQIYGSTVVWEGDGEIFVYDGNACSQLTTSGYGKGGADIYGSNIVWYGYDGNDAEIFFYDGNTTSQLTDNNYGDWAPQIYGSNVVWRGYDGSDGEIFLAKHILPSLQAQIKLTPQMLNCDSHGNWLKAHVILPEEIFPEDIDVNTPAVADPPGVESEFIEVNEYSDGSFDVQIYFEREGFCEALSESEDGSLEVTVTGSLLDGRKFKGSDTIKLKSKLWQHRIRKLKK